LIATGKFNRLWLVFSVNLVRRCGIIEVMNLKFLLIIPLLFFTFACTSDGPNPVPNPVPNPEPMPKVYPEHWGEPPALQTRDIVELPGGYGQGSSTLRAWIQKKLDADAAAEALSFDAAQAQLAAKERELADIRDFLTRARLTPEGLAMFEARIADLEHEIAALKARIANG